MFCPQCRHRLAYTPIECPNCGKAVGVGEQLKPRLTTGLGIGWKILVSVIGIAIVAGGVMGVLIAVGVVHISSPPQWSPSYTATMTSAGWPPSASPQVTLAFPPSVMAATVSSGPSSYGVLPSAYTPQLESVQMTTKASVQGAGGFGVVCRQGVTNTEYVFLLKSGGWEVDRSPLHGAVTSIKSGQVTGMSAITNPHTVTASCIEAPDGSSTSLTLTIDGAQVTNFSDQWAAVNTSGWTTGVVAYQAQAAPATVSFSAFSVAAQVN